MMFVYTASLTACRDRMRFSFFLWHWELNPEALPLIGPALMLLFYSETGFLTCRSWPWTHSVDHTGGGHLGRPFLAWASYISLLKGRVLLTQHHVVCDIDAALNLQKKTNQVVNPMRAGALVDSRDYNSKYLMKALFWPSAVQGLVLGIQERVFAVISGRSHEWHSPVAFKLTKDDSVSTVIENTHWWQLFP